MAKLNKKLIYKFGAPIGVAAAVIAPLATMVSCSVSASDKPGDSWQFSSHRFVQEIVPGMNDFESPSTGPQAFGAPGEYSFDSSSSAAKNSEKIFLFRPVKASYDKPSYTTNADGVRVLEKIVPNRTTQFRFDYVKGLNVVFDNGAIKSFDNDSLSLAEAGSQANWEKSINGLDANGDSYLNIALHSGKVKTLQMVFKDNLSQKHWIQQTTGKAGYELKPEDIFYGFSLFMAYESDLTAYNMSGLTAAEYKTALEKFNKMAPNSNLKEPTTGATPSLMWTANINYGLDINPYRTFDSSKVIKEVNGQKVYNFDFDASSSSDGIQNFLSSWLMRGTKVSAVSSDEIEAVKLKYGKEIEDAFGPSYKNSLLEKAGYLPWLMAKRDEHYVAGKYYIAKSDAKELIMEQNTEYIDERWLNMKNSKGELTTIKTYKYKYIDKDAQANVNVMNAYRMGTGAVATFTSLSIDNQVEAITNPKEWGVKYSVGYTSNKIIGGDRSTMQLMPVSANGKDLNVYFNDGYSKVMWGKTISELKAQGGSSWVESVFSGNGFIFRNNLDALINEFTVSQNATQTRLVDFHGFFAPEGQIGTHGANITLAQMVWNKWNADHNYQGADATEKEVLSFLNQLYRLSSKWAVSHDAGGSFKFDEVTRDVFIKAYSDAQLNHYGPTQAFKDIIVANIKKALDNSNLNPGEKVTWELPVGRGNTSATINPEYKGMIEFINSIDPRLNCVMQLEGVKESQPNPNPNVEVASPDRAYTNSGTAISQNPIWINRLFNRGVGYNAGSLGINEQYKEDTPASPIMDFLGNLQLGTLQGLSYFADAGNAKIQNNVLSPLQTIIDSLSSSLSKLKSSFWNDSQFNSTFGKTNIKLAANSLDFKDIWKSDIKDLATYDELGFSGLQAIRDKKNILTSQATLSADDKQTLDDISYFEQSIKVWYSIARADLRDKFATMNTGQIADVMTAFGVIAPKAFNPYDTAVGDRTRASVRLEKNWITDTGMDSYSAVSIGRKYVDLDVDKDGVAIIDVAY